MKIYELKLKPHSAFISSIHGDTLFGSLCWQIHNLGLGLDNLLQNYTQTPFMVVSSGFYYAKGAYFLPRPLCPNYLMFPNTKIEDKKKNNKKHFFQIHAGEDMDISRLNFDTMQSFSCLTKREHNSVSRLTGTTANEEFAPFQHRVVIYQDFAQIVVFVGIDETRFSKDDLLKIFIQQGRLGFGKRASVGYGHFTVESCTESLLWKRDFSADNCLYALSPFVLSPDEQAQAKRVYFQPFTKYGKHGDVYAGSSAPFKKPVIMADTASIVAFDKPFSTEKPYIGQGLTGLSYVDNKTVAQGYALCLPCKLRDL